MTLVVGVFGVDGGVDGGGDGGVGAGLGLCLRSTQAEEGGKCLVEVAVVAGGIAGELGERLGSVSQFAVGEGVAEGDGAVVGMGCVGLGCVGLGCVGLG